MNKIIPIFFVADNGYVKIANVAIESLVANASKDYLYHIHILCEGMIKENQKSFKDFEKKGKHIKIFIDDISKSVAKRADLMVGKYYNGHMIYYRAFIPRLFPQYNKVIYLDADIVLNGDISELFNMDMGRNYLIATTDSIVVANPVLGKYVEKFIGIKASEYFNSGVLVMDSRALRDINLEDKFFDILSKVQLDVAPDQDCFNYICHGKVKYIPNVWDKMPVAGGNEPVGNVKLVHYNLTEKPWLKDDVLYGEIFWKHAKNTPFYKELRGMKHTVTPEDIKRGLEKLGTIMALCEELSKGETLRTRLKNGGKKS